MNAVLFFPATTAVALCVAVFWYRKARQLKRRNLHLLRAASDLDGIFREVEREHTRWLQRVAASELTDDDRAEIDRTRAAWRHDGPRWNRFEAASDLWKGVRDGPKD